MFEPIMFHNAISDFFLKTATIDVINSGNDVHIAIIVSHITLSLIPTISAIFIAQFTTRFHQTINQIKPKII
jgi:hypothetical protein